MKKVDFEIEHIRLLDADHVPSYSTIGSAAPVGICGTGCVGLAAEILRVGVSATCRFS